MTNETHQKRRPGSNLVEASRRIDGQVINCRNLKVGKLMVFRMAPNSFHRVGVWRVCRKPERFKLLVSRQESLHHLGSVDSRAIPDQLYGALNLLPKLPKKINDRLCGKVHVRRKQVESQSRPLCFPTERQGRNGRNFSVSVPGRKEGGFSSGSESPLPNRKKLKTGFVYEDEGRLFREGFFLISGKVSASQRATFSGFLSRATFSGRWKDHPILAVRILNT
jgi:hypothetical protein